LPRRYHRPPAVKRRKPKKTSPGLTYEDLVGPDNGDAPSSGVTAPSEMRTYSPVAAPVDRGPSRSSGPATSAGASKHVTRDYSYVRREVVRILAVAGFLLVSLIITSILR